jgi:Spondin_N
MRSIRKVVLVAGIAGLGALALAPSAMAGSQRDGSQREYEVTITDLTGAGPVAGQPLTPPVVTTHGQRHDVFDVGAPASVGVREIAENGNSAPLLAFLEADPLDQFGGFAESTTGPLVPPDVPGDAMFDQTAELNVTAGRGENRLSWVSMLICTNDGFTGVDGLRLPSRVGKEVSAETNAYDAFTEDNTEDYAHMVPPCQGLIGDSSGEPGTGVSDPALAEGGVITHHAGIQGGADLEPDLHGWEDPVATIAVERTG